MTEEITSKNLYSKIAGLLQAARQTVVRAVNQTMVYTYYEFEVLPGDRMTDEAWRTLLESGQAPEQPAWILPIMAD